MAIEPVGCLVLVTFEEIDDIDPTFKRMKAGGFVIPETEDKNRKQASMDKGVIVAVGEGANFLMTNPPKVGDYIGYARHAGKIITDMDNPEQKYIIINDEDVQCIYKRA